MNEAPEVMNYDPNLTNSGRMAKQQVRLVFGLWDHRAERIVTVGGNCTGLTIFETAVENVYEDLEEEDGIEFITLTNAVGDTLECEDDENEGSDFLKNMLISAEIISITPDEG